MKQPGFSGQKGRALVELASALAQGDVDLEALAELDDDNALAHLLVLRGIGRWTAEYVLLRGLGRLDRFITGQQEGNASMGPGFSPEPPAGHAMSGARCSGSDLRDWLLLSSGSKRQKSCAG